MVAELEPPATRDLHPLRRARRGIGSQRPALPAGVRLKDDWLGCFADGWTSEDADLILPEISVELGVTVVIVWDHFDVYGGGGHSDLALLGDDGCLYEAPGGLWAALVDGERVRFEAQLGALLHRAGTFEVISAGNCAFEAHAV